MRFTLFCASTALAASFMLSACSSGGGSQALPGGQSVAPMGHHENGPMLVLAGVKDQTTCPSSTGSTYLDCYDITAGKKFKAQWCIVYTSKENGTCDSSILYPGTWTWTVSKVIAVSNGKKTKKIKNSWKPNPGNPTENYIKSKSSVKSTGGTVGYYIELEAATSSQTVGPYEIGIVVSKKK